MPKFSLPATVLTAFFFCLFAFAPPFLAAAPAKTAPLPAIIYDVSALPAPVRLMRERILKAAKSGNIEALRPLFAHKNGATRIVPEGSKQDPIAYLKEISADGQGLEILANLAQILQTGAVHLNGNGREDSYIWPYFAAYPPQNLSPKQLVEAYQIMSVDDLDTIKEIGHYVYFRLAIAPDGQWRFLLTGDDSADKAKDGAANADAPPLPNPGGLPSPDDSGDLPADE